MLTRDDIENLATLSRIDLAEEEKDELLAELEAILGYISEISEVIAGEVEPQAGELRNVMREDTDPHEPGIHTQDILDDAPDSEDGYLKVKQIL